MSFLDRFRLPSIENDLTSPDQPTRFRASDQLRQLAKKDSSLHSRIATVAQSLLTPESQTLDAYTAMNLLQALDEILGPQAVSPIRLRLLENPPAPTPSPLGLAPSEFLPGFILNLPPGREFTPVLLDLYSKSGTNVSLKTTILSKLVRNKAPEALGLLLAALPDPEMRPHAVTALQALGDPSAIAYLETYRNDRTEAWEVDNHGPMQTVGDLVGDAVRSLSSVRR